MPNFSRTDTFKKQYKKLPGNVQEKFKKQILLFVEDPNHPSLKTKKNHAATNKFSVAVFESRIDKAYRFLWMWDGNNLVLLLAIGDHEIVENKK